MPETFVKSYQIDAPLLKVFELDPKVPCLSGVFVSILQKEIQEKKDTKGRMPGLSGGRFSRSPSLGSENTLAGLGGPARPGALLPASFPIWPLAQLCNLHIKPAPPASRPQEGYLSFLGLGPYS